MCGKFHNPCKWCESRKGLVPTKKNIGDSFQNGCFGAKIGKMGPIKMALAPKPVNFFDEVMGVCGFFLQVKFDTSLLALLARGIKMEYHAVPFLILTS